MKKNSIAHFSLFLLSVVFFSSCGEKSYFAFENVRYVDKFPVSRSVHDADTLGIEAVGILGIKSFRDFILLSCHDEQGCMSAFSKTDGSRISAPFMKIGRGPGELLYQPFICWFDFRETPEGIMAGIYDYNGKFLEYDILQSLEAGVASWRCVADSLSVSGGARYFRAGNDRLICRSGDLDDVVYERFLVGFSGDVSYTRAMETLNAVTASDTNLLSTLFAYNEDKYIMAELGGVLSIIHLYSLEDCYHETLCIGRKLENIHDMERLHEDESSVSYYDVKPFDDFFAGLYLNTSIGKLDANEFSPALHLFSWTGEPLAEILLPVPTLYFDIDVADRCLYIVENETETVLKFDISGILSDMGC